MTTPPLDAVLARVDADLDASLERLFALLRIPSISTQPAHRDDCRRAAELLSADLSNLGFESRLVSMPEVPTGHPLVMAHDKDAPEGAPHVVFYGHYDVQPVDPLNLWEADPFEPQIETRPDGTKLIRGRGTSDDKGQLMTFVEACRAWKAVAGKLPVKVSILLEGEEESGGKSMQPFLQTYRDEVKADLALVCDTTMWNARTPAICASLRGMAGQEVIIKAADRDLHSGFFGSAARNPNALLAQILADLRDENGGVTLPGFYDGVPEPSAELKANWERLGFDAAAFLGGVGLSVPAGEKDRSVMEQTWTRPTCEINGMIGGYTDQGFKTVIPAQASAKVSFRLVGDQDPAKVVAAFRQHVLDRLPADCEAEFIDHSKSAAISVDLESKAVQSAAAVLGEEWGAETALVGMGGSIPVVGDFKRILDMDSLLVGFGLEDDRIHSPNEKYELLSFHKGARSWARILGALADGV